MTAAAEDILIAADGLTRYYGDRCVLRDVNVQLHRGEVLGFLGPNGAGKSTTMRILSGVLSPSSGSIRIGGIDLLEDPQGAKRWLGYLPEQPPVYQEFTVDEFLEYCARLHRVEPATLSGAIARAKLRCGLNDVGSRLIGNLSKGYQQRIGIAQAIAHSPAVVILDEPTAGLDPIQIREIRELIRELRNDHGVILSTHILPEVQAVCDRVLLIHQGRIVLDSSLQALAGPDDGWRVTLKRAPALESLRAIAGVDRVAVIDTHRFVLLGNQLDGESLARIAVDKDWGLVELAPHGRTLEEIFVQLISSDTPQQTT